MMHTKGTTMWSGDEASEGKAYANAWSTPKRSSDQESLPSWVSSPQTTEATDEKSLPHAIDDGGRSDYKPRRCRCLCLSACLVFVLTAVGLGLIFGLRENDAQYDAPDKIRECPADANGANSVPCCNGLESNCRLRVNEMVFAGSHNSMSSAEDGFLAANHQFPLEESLRAGYRALFLDLCECGDRGVQFCHTACKAGTRDTRNVFGNIRDFLKANPTEVIIIEFQVGTPQELVFDLYDVMLTIDGLVDYLYQHPNRSTLWPRMGELVGNNTRLILFQHDGPNCFKGQCPPGFHSTYGYMFETSYALKGVDDVLDYDTSCQATRGNTRSDFFLLNHFASNRFGLPAADMAEELNKQAVVYERVAACSQRVGKPVSFIVVDFWAKGNVPKVTQILNYDRAKELGATLAPTASAPSASPTLIDLEAPSMIPSVSPTTTRPTSSPSVTDTLTPTLLETSAPSLRMTAAPTIQQTMAASNTDTASQSAKETVSPSSPTSSTPPAPAETSLSPNTLLPSSAPPSLLATESPSSTLSFETLTNEPSALAVTETNLPTSKENLNDPLIVSETWFQCSGDSSCGNGYENSVDCLGIDSNCPDGQTCTLFCESPWKQFCYFDDSDECVIPVVQCDNLSTPCPDGARCVTEFSRECGTRVCKNTTIMEDFQACIIPSECKDDDDCSGGDVFCANYFEDCGIAD